MLGANPSRGLAQSSANHCPLFNSIMFNLSGSVVRTSAAAKQIDVNVLAGTCTVMYTYM